MGDVTRPVLKYHGGKWRIAPWIISHFPVHRVYTEVFGGAASVLLRKPGSKIEVYNDIHEEVVNFFRVLRDRTQAEELVYQLSMTPYSHSDYRQSLEPSEDPIESARRLVVRSHFSVGTDAINRGSGIGAGFRNYTGEALGGTSAHQWLTVPDAIKAAADRWRGVIVENRDATCVLQQHDSLNTLHYVDPPYPLSTRGKTPGAYRQDMTDADHRTLAETLHGLQGMVVLSGYPCELYDELYAGWRCVTRATHAHTAHSGATDRTEALWISPNAVQQPSLFEEASA